MLYTLIILIALLDLLFVHLVSQSKRPRGFVGVLMMKLWNRTYLPMVCWASGYIKGKKVNNILDVGVGNGGSTAYLTELFPNANITGIDLSETAIAEAYKQPIKGKVSFAVKDITQTDYLSASFDLICAFQTHFHWRNAETAYTEIHRLLTDSGVLLIACEKSKIRYYLRDLEETGAFSSYMEHFGLYLEETAQQNGWVLFVLLKKPVANS